MKASKTDQPGEAPSGSLHRLVRRLHRYAAIAFLSTWAFCGVRVICDKVEEPQVIDCIVMTVMMLSVLWFAGRGLWLLAYDIFDNGDDTPNDGSEARRGR